MHALHLPPRHFFRTGLLALLLTFAVMLALASPLEVGSLGDATSAPGPAAKAAPASASEPAGPPRWVTDPVAPPSIGR